MIGDSHSCNLFFNLNIPLLLFNLKEGRSHLANRANASIKDEDLDAIAEERYFHTYRPDNCQKMVRY
ncbi:MAG: hypothetical protein WBM86_32140 [Waterburya sp.]